MYRTLYVCLFTALSYNTEQSLPRVRRSCFCPCRVRDVAQIPGVPGGLLPLKGRTHEARSKACQCVGMMTHQGLGASSPGLYLRRALLNLLFGGASLWLAALWDCSKGRGWLPSLPDTDIDESALF